MASDGGLWGILAGLTKSTDHPDYMSPHAAWPVKVRRQKTPTEISRHLLGQMQSCIE